MAEITDNIKFRRAIFDKLNDIGDKGVNSVNLSYEGYDYEITVDYDFVYETAYTGVEFMGDRESYLKRSCESIKVIDAICFEAGTDKGAVTGVLSDLLRQDVIYNI